MDLERAMEETFREAGWLSPEEAEELGREHKAKELQWAEEAEKLRADVEAYRMTWMEAGWLAPEPARRLVEAAENVLAVGFDAFGALRDALAAPAVKALKEGRSSPAVKGLKS